MQWHSHDCLDLIRLVSGRLLLACNHTCSTTERILSQIWQFRHPSACKVTAPTGSLQKKKCAFLGLPCRHGIVQIRRAPSCCTSNPSTVKPATRKTGNSPGWPPLPISMSFPTAAAPFSPSNWDHLPPPATQQDSTQRQYLSTADMAGNTGCMTHCSCFPDA